MKSILNYLENEEVKESKDVVEGLSPEQKKQLQDLKNEIDKIVKKMNLGDFTYKGSTADTVMFAINSRYSWYIKYSMIDIHKYELQFGSVPSYGSFTFEEEPYKMYKSIGVILDQESDLRAIAGLFNDIKNILY